MASGGSKKAVVAALLANTGIAVAKFVGFFITGSGAMLAEATHSVADAGNQGLLLLGHARAKRRPTPRHPFGFQRELFFWPFIVAVVLFTLGAGFSAHEGIEKLLHPHEITSPGVALGILGFGIVLEGFSFRTAIIEANRIREGLDWWTFIRVNKSADLNVVLLEDLAAQLGLVFAFIGVGLAALTGNEVWDAIATISIAVLLAAVAIILAIEIKSLLIGEAADPDEIEFIRSTIAEARGVLEVVHVMTEHRGPDEILVAAKARFDPTLRAAEVARTINDTEAAIRARIPAARYLVIEVEVPV